MTRQSKFYKNLSISKVNARNVPLDTAPRGAGRIEFEGECERMQREGGEKVGRSITLAGARFYEPKF